MIWDCLQVTWQTWFCCVDELLDDDDDDETPPQSHTSVRQGHTAVRLHGQSASVDPLPCSSTEATSKCTIRKSSKRPSKSGESQYLILVILNCLWFAMTIFSQCVSYKLAFLSFAYTSFPLLQHFFFVMLAKIRFFHLPFLNLRLLYIYLLALSNITVHFVLYVIYIWILDQIQLANSQSFACKIACIHTGTDRWRAYIRHA